MADEQTQEGENAAPPKKSKLPLVMAMLVLLGGGGAGWYFVLGPGVHTEEADGEAVEEEVHHEPIYFTLADNLVVNFREAQGARYLQVGIDLMTFDEDSVHALEQHAPVLRSNLILLLSDQAQENLLTREGKEVLREEALQEVRHSMEELHGTEVVEALYFTNFVMQ